MKFLLELLACLGLWFGILFACAMILSVSGVIIDQLRERKAKKEIYKMIKSQIKKDYNK